MQNQINHRPLVKQKLVKITSIKWILTLILYLLPTAKERTPTTNEKSELLLSFEHSMNAIFWLIIIFAQIAFQNKKRKDHVHLCIRTCWWNGYNYGNIVVWFSFVIIQPNQFIPLCKFEVENHLKVILSFKRTNWIRSLPNDNQRNWQIEVLYYWRMRERDMKFVIACRFI